MEVNIMYFFWQKVVILHFGFWSQEAKKAQKSLKRPHEGNTFCILDRTKNNFGILHSIIPK